MREVHIFLWVYSLLKAESLHLWRIRAYTLGFLIGTAWPCSEAVRGFRSSVERARLI
jgi:hypothetical protein